MSIMSADTSDYSNYFYTRFATIIISVLKKYPDPIKDIDKIPLSGIYRLLEMYKYNAYADDDHVGVTDLRGTRKRKRRRIKDWQSSVVYALDIAFSVALPNLGKEDQIYLVQELVHYLEYGLPVREESRNSCLLFFTKFEEILKDLSTK